MCNVIRDVYMPIADHVFGALLRHLETAHNVQTGMLSPAYLTALRAVRNAVSHT